MARQVLNHCKHVCFVYKSGTCNVQYLYLFSPDTSEDKILEDYKKALKMVLKRKKEFIENRKNSPLVKLSFTFSTIITDLHYILEEKFGWERLRNVDRKFYADGSGEIIIGKGYRLKNKEESPYVVLEKLETIINKAAFELEEPYYTVEEVKRILSKNEIFSEDGEILSDNEKLYLEDLIVDENGNVYKITASDNFLEIREYDPYF